MDTSFILFFLYYLSSFISLLSTSYHLHCRSFL